MKQEIESKLERLEKRASMLKDYSDVDLETLEEDDLLRDAIERNFQVALEIVLDISSMIVSYENLEKPDNYRETIKRLGEAGILDEEFAESFQNAASFRNILVHHYTEVDQEKLHEYLSENLGDFDRFTQEVAEYAQRLEE